MLRQSKRPDWDSRSVCSRSDVTALLSPDSPCSVVNHMKPSFKGAQKFEDLTKSKKFLRHITPQNKLYCFSEKKIWGLGALSVIYYPGLLQNYKAHYMYVARKVYYVACSRLFSVSGDDQKCSPVTSDKWTPLVPCPLF